jgi:hypothetical protein
VTQTRFWLAIFLLGAALNIAIGAESWPAVLAGSLNDPDSYMRLERIYQGVQIGHLTNFVARDGAGRGVMVEWSRLLDGLIWLMAAPLAVFLGWKQALFVAGVALGPLGAGVLSLAVAFAAEPFVPRRFVWFAAIAAVTLPGIAGFALPGVVHYHVLLLAMIAFTGGFAARTWQGETGPAFLAGLWGGLAIWLTPETMPFILMIFAALLGRWLMLPIGAAIAACGAGFVDMIGFGFAIDPPAGGYGVIEIDRLSLVYVVLGLFLLAGSLGLWRLETNGFWRSWRWWGAAGMAALILVWVGLFPGVAEGPYGLMSPAQMREFLGVITELQPTAKADLPTFLLPGAVGFAYALWRLLKGRGLGGRWLWGWAAICIAVSLVLARKFALFVEFPQLAAAVMLPVMLSQVSFALAARPAFAMLGRLTILTLMLVVPALNGLVQARAQTKLLSQAASPVAGAGSTAIAACSLRDLAPYLVGYAGQMVVASPEDAAELLYRTRLNVVGSLYQHGLPGYFALRDIWRSQPRDTPALLAAAQASLVLVCPAAGRSLLVADLSATTFWDALNTGHPPSWLQPVQLPPKIGYRLYKVVSGLTSVPPVIGAGTPVVPGSDSGKP